LTDTVHSTCVRDVRRQKTPQEVSLRKFDKELHRVIHKDEFPFFPHVYKVVYKRIKVILDLLEGHNIDVDKKINKIRKGEL